MAAVCNRHAPEPQPKTDVQNPYRPPGAPPAYGYQHPAIPSQSGLGIASFIIAVVSVIITVGIFVSIFSEVNAARYEYGDYTPGRATNFMMIGLAVIGVMFVALVGMILGFIALTQPHRNRVWSVLGTILNGLIILGFITLMVIGQMR